MDEKEKRVRVRGRRSREEVVLPKSFLEEVLLNLSTKEAIKKTSVLSKRWKDIWRGVPGLDLNDRDFPDINAFLSFVNKFLSFNNSDSPMRKFKLKFGWDDEIDEPDVDLLNRCIENVVKRQVEHLRVMATPLGCKEVRIPATVYTCQKLVTLELRLVTLPNPEFVSLPCTKVMVLDGVLFANDLAFEKFISGCPLLQSLTVIMNYCSGVKLLRVCSKSLLRFTYDCPLSELDFPTSELVLEIDAPKLQYLKLKDYVSVGYNIINTTPSLVEVDIDVLFKLMLGNMFDLNDFQRRRENIRNFLIGISHVQVMNISTLTLEVIYHYARCEQLPIFANLSLLRANFNNYQCGMLPTFMATCPNLKSLELEFGIFPLTEVVTTVPDPQIVLPSLESFKIVKSMVLSETIEMNLVSYFLHKTPNLKEFSYILGKYKKNQEYIQKLLAIPRLSSSCQVYIP